MKNMKMSRFLSQRTYFSEDWNAFYGDDNIYDHINKNIVCCYTQRKYYYCRKRNMKRQYTAGKFQ